MAYLLTVEDVRQYLIEIKPKSVNLITDDTLKWLNCVINAHSFTDMTLKDIANFLADGCESFSSLEGLQSTIDTYHDDDEEEYEFEESDRLLRNQLCRFIGRYDLVVEDEDE